MHRKMSFRLYRTALVFVVLCGCSSKDPVERPAVPVRVQVVSISSEASASRYSASIRADVQVDLAYRVGGYVEDILSITGSDGESRHVQEGDFVRKGTVLARIRDTEYRDRMMEAESALRRAKADFDRASDLYESRSVSRADFDAASAQYTSAQARYNQAAETLEDCTIEAPLDGYVLARRIEVGSLASVGIPAFVLADTRVVKVVYGVPDVEVGSLRTGSKQLIKTAAIPGELFEGTISRISAAADPNSRVFEVECTIPNPDNRLRVGMIASLESNSTTQQPPRIVIPLNAIIRPPGQPDGYAVFIVEGDGPQAIARLRQVTLGEVIGDAITVLSGVTSGDRIVITGASLITDSQSVRIIP